MAASLGDIQLSTDPTQALTPEQLAARKQILQQNAASLSQAGTFAPPSPLATSLPIQSQQGPIAGALGSNPGNLLDSANQQAQQQQSQKGLYAAGATIPYQQPANPFTPAAVPTPAAASTPPAPAQAGSAQGLQQIPATQQQQPSAYQQTGIGTGLNQIVMTRDANGVPTFTNAPSAQAGAAPAPAAPVQSQGLQAAGVGVQPQPVVLGANGQPVDQAQDFASLGSVNNLGNGIGAFSQAQPGDAALSMSRFAAADQLRDLYANKDRLADANSRQYANDHTTVVRDSTQPFTRADLTQAGADQKRADNLAAGVTAAQGQVDSGLQDQAKLQSIKSAAELDSLQQAASAPGATVDAQNRYLQVKDPAGYLQAQQKAPQAVADLLKTQAQTARTQQQIQQSAQTNQQAQADRANNQEGKIATFDQALGSVSSLLGKQVDPKNPDGPRLDEDPGLSDSLGGVLGVNAITPTRPGSPAADFQARLDTLKSQTFLPQVAALKGTGSLSNAEGEKLTASVGALSTKMSPEAFRASLKDIAHTLQAARDRTVAASPSGAKVPPAPQITIPTLTSADQYSALPSGHQFIDPNGALRTKP